MHLYKPENIEYCLKIATGIITSPIPPRHISKPISLANYDVGFVNNAVRSINKGEGLSDRQRELSVKLVKKYARQYKRLGIDISEIVIRPSFESTLRQVDRLRYFDIEEEKISIKFPYNKDMIREFNAIAKKLRASKSMFNKEEKKYYTDYNEYNFLSLYNWAAKYNFGYSDTVKKLYNDCQNIINNRKEYAIQLVVNDDKCFLRNAPDSLNEYWVNTMKSESPIKQIVSAADQNIDIVNNSSKINLSSLGIKILQTRGGRFDWLKTKPIDIYNSAVNEFGFKKIAFIIDGRTMTEELTQNLLNMVSKLGKDVCTVQLKHNKHHFKSNKTLTLDTKFAIIDSVQRYTNPRVKHDWKPDFVISTNTVTKYRRYGFNVIGGQTGVSFNTEAWICHYTFGTELGKDSADGEIIN
jgi:roadblock/LC7 domain-containing protein